MESLLTQVGVGGILAILILREVFNFLKNKNCKSNKENPSDEISRTEFERHKDAVQYKDTCGQIVKRLDKRFDTVDENFKDVKLMLGDLKP